MSLLTAFLLLLTGCEIRSGSDLYPAVCTVSTTKSTGSGTLIGSNDSFSLMLTAGHVAGEEGNDVVMTWLVNGKEQTTFGKVILVLEGGGFEHDQALIMGQHPVGVKPLPVGKFKPGAGPLVCVGWRNGKLYESIARSGKQDGDLIKLDQPLIGGMSGGPCLQNGVVVGVNVGSNRVNNAIISNGKALEDLVKLVSGN